jgi:chemotaxis protein MotB
VRGHTDNVPIRYSDWKDNWELSGARARSVLHYLVSQEGFQRERVSFAGYGPTKPVASNNSASGRRKNRRAEIVVLPQNMEVEERRAQN